MEPTLELLTGAEAGAMLAAAVEASGGRLLTWHPTLVDHRPRTGTSVAYAVRVARAEDERDETFAASTAHRGAAPGDGSLRPLGEQDLRVWRYPDDPHLPALAAAADTGAVRSLLADLGVMPPGLDDDQLELVTRTYRPARRAVLEARFPAPDGGRGRVFLKVVRPSRAADIHRRHRLLHENGIPVPAPLGWTDAGLVVLMPAQGEGLRGALRRDGVQAVDPLELVAMLDRLPESLLDLPRRRSWSDSARHYAGIVGAALPSSARRAVELAAAISAGLRGMDEAVVPVHGDFYEAQLLVTGARLTGVLDVDSAGPGHRGDDLGCLLAHVEVLAQIASARGRAEESSRLRAVAARWREAFDAAGYVDPATLRLRAAGVLMSLATGPYRVQDPGWQEATVARLDLVEAWVLAGQQLRAG
jgi:hypothetical protein